LPYFADSNEQITKVANSFYNTFLLYLENSVKIPNNCRYNKYKTFVQEDEPTLASAGNVRPPSSLKMYEVCPPTYTYINLVTLLPPFGTLPFNKRIPTD
jgi:hypothetical protein